MDHNQVLAKGKQYVSYKIHVVLLIVMSGNK